MFKMSRLAVVLTVLASYAFADDRVRIATVELGPTQALENNHRHWDELGSIEHQDGSLWKPCEYSTVSDKEFYVPLQPQRNRVKALALIAESRNCTAKPISPVALASTPPAKPLVQTQPAKTEVQAKVQPAPIQAKYQPSVLTLTPRARETALEKELSAYRARLNSADDARVQMIRAMKDDLEQNYIRKDGVVPKEQHERDLAKARLIGTWSTASVGLICAILGFFGNERLRNRNIRKRSRKAGHHNQETSQEDGVLFFLKEPQTDNFAEPVFVARYAKSHHDIPELPDLKYRGNGFPITPSDGLTAVQMQHFALHRKVRAWMENNPSVNAEVVAISDQNSSVRTRSSERRTDKRTAIA